MDMSEFKAGRVHFRPRGYKTFFKLNSAEREIFSANKYENANNSWHFHIYKQRNFHAQLYLVRKDLQLLVGVLRFYGPVNPMGSCRARSVYLTTFLLGRLSPLSG